MDVKDCPIWNIPKNLYGELPDLHASTYLPKCQMWPSVVECHSCYPHPLPMAVIGLVEPATNEIIDMCLPVHIPEPSSYIQDGGEYCMNSKGVYA